MLFTHTFFFCAATRTVDFIRTINSDDELDPREIDSDDDGSEDSDSDELVCI